MLTRLWNRLSSLFEWLLTVFPGKGLAAVALLTLTGLAVYYVWFSDSPVGDRLGWYGIWVGLFALWYTVSQLYQTRQAAEATRDALKQAGLTAYRLRVERTRGYLQEAVTIVNTRRWGLANFRLHDAAAELRRIQNERQHADDRWNRHALALSQWADYFRTGQDNRALLNFTAADMEEWAATYHGVLAALEAEIGAGG